MKISEITLSYPCTKYDVEVKHFTARKSTAIEWIILETIKKVSAMPQYADMSIGKLFREILMISDANLIIKPCILQLQGIRALDAVDIGDDIDLDTVPMKNLKLTSEGLQMQKQGLLPGAENDNRFSVMYLQHKDTLMEINAGVFKDTPGGVQAINPDDEEKPFPSALIRDYLEKKRLGKHSKKNAFSWLLETTTINDVNPINSSICWLDQTKKVQIGRGMKCFIDDIDSDEVCSSALEKIEVPEAEIFKNAPFVAIQDPDVELKDIILPAELRKNISEAMFHDDIYIISEYFTQHTDITLNQVGKSNKRNKTILIAGNTGFSSEIIGKQIIFHIPMDVLAGDSVYIGKSGSIHIGKITVHTDSLSRDLPIAFIPSDETDELTYTCIQLVNLYYAQYPEILMLLVAIDEYELLAEYIRKAIQEKKTISEKTDYISNLNKVSSSAYGKQLVTPDQLSNFLVDESAIKAACTDCISLCKLLKDYSNEKIFTQNDDLFLSVLRKALPNIQPPQSIKDIWSVWNTVFEIKKSLVSRIYRDGLAQPLYSEAIIHEFLEMISDDTVFEIAQDYTPIETVILDMKRVIMATEPMLMPEISINGVNSQERVREAILAHRDNISNIYNEICSWQDCEIKFHDRIGNIDDYYSVDGFFRRASIYMHAIASEISVFFNDKTKKYKQIFIIDSCTLLHEPSIFEEFLDNKALLIVPHVVINELHGLKESEDEETAYNAREVIRNINNYESYEWLDLQEESHPELLPPDMDKELNDHKILSIALLYTVKQPVVITDDINMRNSASGMSIKSMDLNGFHKSRQYSTETKKDKKKKKH